MAYSDPGGNSPWSWITSILSIVGGIALCATGIGTGLGVSLIIGGTTSLASNIMSAAGVDGKTASIITSALNIAAGIALCYTPLAGMGASMIGSGIGGIAGGFISESLGGSFESGAGIGNIIGGIAGGQIYKGLVNSRIISFKVSSKKIIMNETDPFTDRFTGPKQGEVVRKINRIKATGRYETLDVIKTPDGLYKLQDGHHTFRALQSLGYRFVRVRYTK